MDSADPVLMGVVTEGSLRLFRVLMEENLGGLPQHDPAGSRFAHKNEANVLEFHLHEDSRACQMCSCAPDLKDWATTELVGEYGKKNGAKILR